MQLDRPLRVVTPSLDGEVLLVLARSEASFTPSEIHRLVVDHSESGIRKVLARLVEQGIVTSRRTGNAFSHHLNRDHLAASAVIEMAEQKTELIRRLRRQIATWATPPGYACLFGSTGQNNILMARKEPRTTPCDAAARARRAAGGLLSSADEA